MDNNNYFNNQNEQNTQGNGSQGYGTQNAYSGQTHTTQSGYSDYNSYRNPYQQPGNVNYQTAQKTPKVCKVTGTSPGIESQEQTAIITENIAISTISSIFCLLFLFCFSIILPQKFYSLQERGKSSFLFNCKSDFSVLAGKRNLCD